MSHEIESIAFANEVPWHGLGNRVNPAVTPEEMVVAAGLDWTVEKKPMFIYTGDNSTVHVPGKFALVRSSDNRVLTTCGAAWTPVQNRDALEFFRDYTESGGATLETAGSLRNGNMVWALAKINKNFHVKGSNGRDEVQGYILLASPHEVGKATFIKTTAIRVVCQNTFNLSLKEDIAAAMYRQSHVKAFNFEKAKETIQLAQDQIAALEDSANKLAAIALGEKDSVRFLSHFFDPAPEGVDEDEHVRMCLEDRGYANRALTQVLESWRTAPGADTETAWGVFNGVTHYFDHVIGKAGDSRLSSAWFGRGAEMKSKVLDGLLELAD